MGCAILNPLDYRDPKAREPDRLLSVSAIIRRLIFENIWTVGSMAFTIVFNSIIWLSILISNNGSPAFLLLLNFVFAPISILLTPLVWKQSELHYQTDTARILLVAFHFLQAVLLPYFFLTCIVMW